MTYSDPLITVLILLNTFLVLSSIRRNCLFRNGIEVNHFLLFSVGYVYYWVIPIAIGHWQLFKEMPAMPEWHQIYSQIESERVIVFLVVAPVMYLSFILGGQMVRVKGLPFGKRSRFKEWTFHPKVLSLLFFFALLPPLFQLVRIRGALFAGYRSSISLDFAAKGPFIASTLVMLSLAIVYSAGSEKVRSATPSFREVIANKYFLSYFVLSLLVVSMGGRLYFASSILALLVYKSVYHGHIRISRILRFSLVSICTLALVGFWRLGIGLGGASTEYIIFYSLFTEPLFTSFSLVAFLRDYGLVWISFPRYLLSNFINLVPTAVLPNKLELMVQPSDYGYFIYSPLGAQNSFVSFMLDFGFLGSVVFLFFFSWWLSQRRKSPTVLSKVVYISCTSWLSFTFFRDGFVTSIVKNIFQFSLLTPFMVVLISHLLSKAVVRGSSRQ